MVDLAPFFIAKTKHIITFLPPPPLRSTLSPHPPSPTITLHTTSIYDCCIYKYSLYLYYNNNEQSFLSNPTVTKITRNKV